MRRQRFYISHALPHYDLADTSDKRDLVAVWQLFDRMKRYPSGDVAAIARCPDRKHAAFLRDAANAVVREGVLP